MNQSDTTSRNCSKLKPQEQPPINALFQVWIAVGFDINGINWWWNSPPQPLRNALQEAAETRANGWNCKVMPENQNPRSDKKWSNP